MRKLTGKVAIAAGGSRGAARGIALALGEAGATVYVAARTTREGPKPPDGAPGTIEDTAEEVTARGGRGIPARVDLSEDAQVEALFQRVQQEQGRLDLLANAVWAAHYVDVWSTPYWELAPSFWRDTVVSMSAYWLTTVHASRVMAKHGGGLIVHVTDNFPDDPSKDRGHVLHDVGHEFMNRLIRGVAPAAKKIGVTVIGLNPGFMQTERVLMHMKSEELKKQFRFHLSESVEFIGRAAVALASDPNLIHKTGQLLWAADLAEEYGFTDVDGRIPRFDYSSLEGG